MHVETPVYRINYKKKYKRLGRERTYFKKLFANVMKNAKIPQVQA